MAQFLMSRVVHFLVDIRSSMGYFEKNELAEALQVVSSVINSCEKIQPRFAVGTSQHTLLKNRIKALHISKSLISNESIDYYAKEELIEALRPVSSIIAKSEKALLKSAGGTSNHTRLQRIIKAMCISKSLITEEINNRD